MLAILSHADWNEVPRDRPLRKALFAVDELCGFVMAVTYVRPSKLIAEVKVKSVNKKLKDKSFARSVSRDDIRAGAADIGARARSAHRQRDRRHAGDPRRAGRFSR